MADVYTLTADEWRAAIQRELDELGITWEQLADMAARRDFATLEARKLWLATGGQRP